MSLKCTFFLNRFGSMELLFEVRRVPRQRGFRISLSMLLNECVCIKFVVCRCLFFDFHESLPEAPRVEFFPLPTLRLIVVVSFFFSGKCSSAVSEVRSGFFRDTSPPPPPLTFPLLHKILNRVWSPFGRLITFSCRTVLPPYVHVLIVRIDDTVTNLGQRSSI